MAAKLIHRDFVGAYVYAISVDGVVRYIGKGRRYRAVEHVRLAREINRRRARGEKIRALPVHNKLAKAIGRGADIQHSILVNNLTDEAAYFRERLEIETFPAGQLWNIKQGGAGGDADMMRRLWADPEQREKWTKAIAAGHRDPEYRDRARKTASDYWNDPAYRAEKIALHKAFWADPENRSARCTLLKKVWADPEKARRKSALVKAQWTPERKAAQAAQRRAAWADPEFSKRVRAKIAATRAKPEFRKKISETVAKRWADPEFKEKVSRAIRAAAKRN